MVFQVTPDMLNLNEEPSPKDPTENIAATIDEGEPPVFFPPGTMGASRPSDQETAQVVSRPESDEYYAQAMAAEGEPPALGQLSFFPQAMAAEDEPPAGPAVSTSVLEDYPFWKYYSINSQLGLSKAANFDAIATSLSAELRYSLNPADRMMAEALPFPAKDGEYDAEDYTIAQLDLNDNMVNAAIAEAGTGLLSSTAGLAGWRLAGEALRATATNPKFRILGQAASGLSALAFTDAGIRDLVDQGFPEFTLDPNKRTPGANITGRFANVLSSGITPSTYIGQQLSKVNGPIELVTQRLRDRVQNNTLLRNPDFLLANPRNWAQKLVDSYQGTQNAVSLNARTLAGSALNDLIKIRQTEPGRYLIGEAAALIGAGAGVATAVAVDPGDLSSEITGEVAGSVLATLSPTAFVISRLGSLGSGLFNFAKSPLQTTKEAAGSAYDYIKSADARRTAKADQRKWDFARQYLEELFEAAGEDPAEIAARLIEEPIVWVNENDEVIQALNPDFPGINPGDPETYPDFARRVHFLKVGTEAPLDKDGNPTSYRTVDQSPFHQTNSKALGILQELLLRGRYGTTEQAVSYGAKTKAAEEQSLAALHTLTSLLLQTGDPNDVRNALLARGVLIDDRLQQALDRSLERAQELATRAGAKPVAGEVSTDAAELVPGEGDTLVQEGELLKKAATETLNAARAIERELYADLNFEITPTNLHRALLNLANPDRAQNANTQVFMGAASEPVYGPAGSPDAGEIIGYKKVNPNEKHPDKFGDGDEFVSLYQRVAQRPEEITYLPGEAGTLQNLDRLEESGFGDFQVAQDMRAMLEGGEEGETYLKGVGLDDPYLASQMDVDITNKTQSLSMVELIGKRSDYLEKVRRFRAQGNYREANAYGYLADAMTKDLIDYENALLGIEDLGKADSTGRLFEWNDFTDVQKKRMGENFFNLNPQQQQLIVANQFSRRLHDVFSRTFGADLVRTNLAGAPAVHPEDIIDLITKPNMLKELVRERQFKHAISQLILPDPEDGIYDPRGIYDSAEEGAGADLVVNQETREIRRGFLSDDPREVNAAVELAQKLRTAEGAYDTVLQTVIANRALDPTDSSVFNLRDTQGVRARMQKIQSMIEVIFPDSVFAKDFTNARKAAVKLTSLKSMEAEINKIRQTEAGVIKLMNTDNPSAFFNQFFHPEIEDPKAAYQALQGFLKDAERFFPKNKLAQLGLSLPDAKAGLRNLIFKNILKNAGVKVKAGGDVSFTLDSLSEFSRMLGYSPAKRGEGLDLVLEPNIPFGKVDGARPLIMELEDAGLVDFNFRRALELVLGKAEMLRQSPEEFLSQAPQDPFNQLLRSLAGIAGAGAARRVGGQFPGMGGTLQLPQIGAQQARELVDVIPASEGADILFQLMDPANKPQLLEMLKSLKINPKDSAGVQEVKARSFYNRVLYKGLYPFLRKIFSPAAISAGLQIPFTDVEEGNKLHGISNKETELVEETLKGLEGEQKETPPEGEPLSAAEPVNVRPIDRSLTMLPRPNIRPAQPQPRSMGPTSPPTSERMQFAGLFPQDITSGLIRQGALSQGVGSLAG
jgi:hypothetical protein